MGMIKGHIFNPQAHRLAYIKSKCNKAPEEVCTMYDLKSWLALNV